MEAKKVSSVIGGEEVIIETGKIAKQASGAVTVRCGGTVVFAAVVGAPESDEPKDFFPLTVDYREKYYAAGKVPGGYFKRESRPSQHETLTSRLIDRPIRSLFPKNYRSEVSISIMVISADENHPADILGMIAASACLVVSDIPFEEAAGSVRVGMIDGEFVLNPSHEQMKESDLDLIVSGTADKISMIEAGANEITEEKMYDAIMFAHEGIKAVVALQDDLAAQVAPQKREVKGVVIPEEIISKIEATVGNDFARIFECKIKEEQDAITEEIKEKALAEFDTESEDWNSGDFKEAFAKVEKEKIRSIILNESKRPDGRGFQDIRAIYSEVGTLPRTHGSALFTRGQTQSLGVVTLGTSDDEQTNESLHEKVNERFYLHYNFPSFSVGEARPNRGPGRREIGHGALAQRSLEAIIPDEEAFPYTIRVVSEIMESNGSSSMASVCAGTLSLMDAGVPIKAPVSGIAMGLVTDGEGNFKVLTDIAGIEDHLGDMDFKAAGTENGLTALQMDLKLAGISEEILKTAFEDSKIARATILSKMTECIDTPRSDLSAYAPRMTTIQVDKEKIGEIIGPGGKNIRKMTEESGAKIDIKDDGTVTVSSADGEAAAKAVAMIEAIVEEPEIGKTYNGEVKKLTTFGAFCEIIPGKDGLLHVSEIADGFVKNPGDYLRVGDKVTVKAIGVDDRGKVSLSVKAINEEGLPLLPEDQRVVVEAEPPRRDRKFSRRR